MASTAHPHILSTDSLSLSRGNSPVVSGVTLSLKTGRGLVVTGRNGSGKTTLLRGLAGLLPITAGMINFNSKRLGDDPMADKAKMIYIGHQDGLARGLTAEENIIFWAKSRGLAIDQDDLTKAFQWLDVSALRQVELRHMSEGQRRRVGLVRLAFDHLAKDGASLWLLDEPLTALDDAATKLMISLIDAQTKNGGSVILSTHQAITLKRSADLHLAEDGLS